MGDVLSRVKAGRMKVERLTSIMAGKNIVRITLGCESRDNELAAACTVDGEYHQCPPNG